MSDGNDSDFGSRSRISDPQSPEDPPLRVPLNFITLSQFYDFLCDAVKGKIQDALLPSEERRSELVAYLLVACCSILFASQALRPLPPPAGIPAQTSTKHHFLLAARRRFHGLQIAHRICCLALRLSSYVNRRPLGQRIQLSLEIMFD